MRKEDIESKVVSYLPPFRKTLRELSLKKLRKTRNIFCMALGII